MISANHPLEITDRVLIYMAYRQWWSTVRLHRSTFFAKKSNTNDNGSIPEKPFWLIDAIYVYRANCPPDHKALKFPKPYSLQLQSNGASAL